MENKKRKIRVGIGFATGRKNFQQVLKTYVYNWHESGLTQRENVELSLLVAYDLKYSNTKETDYTNISQEVRGLIDNTYFIGNRMIHDEIDSLIEKNILDKAQSQLLFANGGYAAKRNAVLYTAIKNHLDCVLFLDDDEYPLAVTRTRSTTVWGGQHVLSTHLQHIWKADITNGYHCGYVSPIPFMDFDSIMNEEVFRTFIEAISNDIIDWDSICSIMKNGGVTYSDTGVLTGQKVEEVPEINHSKFITGANLCVNLTDPKRVSPFYNPPSARGEDTFLSTCLSDRKVLRVPCYTFHDGFSTYHSLMNGVLPINLKYIKADSDVIINRFYRACVGWIRYKPLLMYIIHPDHYEEIIKNMREQLQSTLPKISQHFKKEEFLGLTGELEHYHRNVKKHHAAFKETQKAWAKICNFLSRKKAA